MRRASVACTLVLVLQCFIAGQICAQESANRWSLGVGLDLSSFGSGAQDTTVASGGIDVRPSRSIGLGLSLARGWDAWTVSLGVNFLAAYVEAIGPELAVQARTDNLDRLRIAPVVSRRVARVGSGSLRLGLGPTLDHWSADLEDGRFVLGGEAQLVLALPAGRFDVENLVRFGLSEGPFRLEELPEGYTGRSLWALSVGTSIRFGL